MDRWFVVSPKSPHYCTGLVPCPGEGRQADMGAFTLRLPAAAPQCGMMPDHLGPGPELHSPPE
jgi:hypothetical protein